MDILLILHYIIILIILTLPWLPLNILRYIFFIPLIIPLLWVIFGDCPLTMAHGKNNNNQNFTQEIYSNIIPNISAIQTDNINTFILVLLMTIIAYRFRSACNI